MDVDKLVQKSKELRATLYQDEKAVYTEETESFLNRLKIVSTAFLTHIVLHKDYCQAHYEHNDKSVDIYFDYGETNVFVFCKTDTSYVANNIELDTEFANRISVILNCLRD